MAEDIKELFESVIKTPRNDGRVIYKIKNIDYNLRPFCRLFSLINSPEANKGILLKELGLKNKRIKNKRKRVEKENAHKIIDYLLSRDMAYDFILDTKPMANRLSCYFFDQINPRGSIL